MFLQFKIGLNLYYTISKKEPGIFCCQKFANKFGAKLQAVH